ncbi:Ig-like domain-containing protein [Oligoflexus tunisiensis]|uniref:Ig-like domain-containing protein n=1 Tax=Oligoflexus tunisiensis TaxID=708132 RepID=UPI001C4045DF|nr:Ig-like domain-containing protein [Oligoflexus tunisiensis]
MTACSGSGKKLPKVTAHTDTDGVPTELTGPQPPTLPDRPIPPPPSQAPDQLPVPKPEPSAPDVLPPIDDSVPARDRVLAATGRLCSDTDFGKTGLEVCWKSGVARAISRFDSITLNFSLQRGSGGLVEQLAQDLVNRNFQMLDSKGQKIQGTLVWKDNRTLLFDPYQELLPDTTYQVQILSEPGSPDRPISNHGRPLTPFHLELMTGSAFRMTHRLDGIDLSLQQGLQLSRDLHPSPVLESQLEDADNAKRISLRRLGSRDAWQACDGTCGSTRLTASLKGTLAPEPGVNAYEWAITSQRGETYYRQLAFLWGDLTAARSSTPIHAALDANNGLPAFARLISDFAAGRFTMNYVDEGGQVFPRLDFNGIMAVKKGAYPSVLPGNCDGRAGTQFIYLQNLGPFCNLPVSGQTPILGGWVGKVNYKAVSDIYVTEMKIDKSAGNVSARLVPEQDNLAVHMGVKHFHGRLKIIIRIDEAKYLGISVPGATGYFIFDTAFRMEGPLREAHAKTDMNAKSGRISLRIRGIEHFDLRQPRNGEAQGSTYFDTKDWNDHVVVTDPEQMDPDSGLWASIVNHIVNQAVREKVESFKPQIVNGIARDIIQIVAPNSLSTIAHQLGEGLTLPMPYYLPEPIASYQAKIKGQILDGLGLESTADNRFITAKIAVNIEGIPLEGQEPAPPLKGDPGVLQLSQGPLPTPRELGLSVANGSLLSLPLDAMNQTMHDLWRKGMFNLSLNQQVIRTIERFAVFDPNQLKNGKEILLAEFIPKLMSSDLTRVQAMGPDGKPITIGREDIINLTIKPLLPPVIQLRPDASEARALPRFELAFGDMLMEVKGQHEGRAYTLATIRMALRSKSTLSFKNYSNPKKLKAFEKVGALSLVMDRSAESLDFMVEVLEGPDANPFGFDTEKLRSAVNSMVDELFLPLVNDTLRELPLTGLKTCGLELDAGQLAFMPVPRPHAASTLVLKALIQPYAYSGHCDLKPDMPANPEPLPDPEPEPTPTPTPGPGGQPGDADGEPLPYTLSMDFDPIPWQLGASGILPEVEDECRTQVFYDVSCASARVVYRMVNGVVEKDERGRPIYDYTLIRLFTLVSKDQYQLRKSDQPSVEGQFFDFNRWPEYAQGYEENLIFHESIRMRSVETQYGTFLRHYVDYETNSPKASGFIPIRNVTMHRLLERPFTGAEISTEFFVDLSAAVPVPEGRRPLTGAEGLDYHVGNMHVVDCGKLSWCNDSSQWLMIYDSKLRPEDKSIPEDVVPYLKAALNSIVAGMFP